MTIASKRGEICMYKTLLATKNTNLLSELRALEIWGDKTGFELTCISHSLEETLQSAKKDDYDLIITEIFENNFASYIGKLKKNHTHNIIAVSEELTLENARLCVLSQVSDYFVSPFDADKFSKTLEKLRYDMSTCHNDIGIYIKELSLLFNTQDTAFLDKVKDISERLYKNQAQKDAADRVAKELLKGLAEVIFDKHEWLDLYINKEDIFTNTTNDIKQFFIITLKNLFNDFTELYPYVQNDKILSVILYILNNPESDLKQKSIAANLYMNSSYLSTVFTAHTGQRFVDYLTNVKLHRAAWLLRNTTLKVTDIAERLDYKDIGYFSRLFKKKYSITPSDYRVPDQYDYYI